MWEEVYRTEDGSAVVSIKENKVMFQSETGITYQQYEDPGEARERALRCSEFLNLVDRIDEEFENK